MVNLIRKKHYFESIFLNQLVKNYERTAILLKIGSSKQYLESLRSIGPYSWRVTVKISFVRERNNMQFLGVPFQSMGFVRGRSQPQPSPTLTQ